MDRKSFKENLMRLLISILNRKSFLFDESRFGMHSRVRHGWFKKGARTRVKVKLGIQKFYLYSVVDPRNGESPSLFALNVNTDCMDIFLE
ncbi:hypothetical protein GO684_04885 [Wolbachia endosymbiont of Litomosoides brasiliensis]|uniref:hypothetical protein n=1 Tax=Wolbachia endosymbiont of Litomosoides brasiliensis TaxID=1812117 RepID=UPI001588F198|nr:hypothetical protein [Wolbachia endosymbiont of Litomosoides brasiliensis]NUY39929.1 hypothetical protein [Wolbachia endosymbiont of Litomosoides brasiliensis]